MSRQQNCLFGFFGGENGLIDVKGQQDYRSILKCLLSLTIYVKY